MDPTQPKFLIVKFSSLGDVLHTLPAARTLRRRFPKAHIAWVVEERYQGLLDANPDIDERIVVRTKHWRKNWNLKSLGELLRVLKQLRGRKFDAAFDFHGLIKSGVLVFLSGAKKRIGFHQSDCRETPSVWFNNVQAPAFGTKQHVVDKNLSLLNTLERMEPYKEYPLHIPDEATEYVDRWLKSQKELANRPLVGINPGAGFPTKHWKLSRFAQLADRIAREMDCRILLNWGPGEESLVDAIASEMQEPSWAAPATTIHQSMALFKRLELLVTCDTGPLHLCCALGVRTVSLFGPTDPVRNGPFGEGHRTIYKTQSCSFCYKRKCPYNNECMNEISVDDAFTLVQSSLAKRADAPTT